ncbi:MAG: hypothetical protein ACJASU_000308 [Cognaticolwellia sp.]|jgi:hypothetical protein
MIKKLLLRSENAQSIYKSKDYAQILNESN